MSASSSERAQQAPARGRASDGAEVQLTRPLLSVNDLKTWFPVHKGVFRKVVDHVKAVDGVSFTIEQGRTLALVGESGSGKTTVGRSILRLVEPAAGTIRFLGDDVLSKRERELSSFRRQVQMVFQDPMTSLNPRMRVLDLIAEGLDSFGLTATAEQREARVVEVLSRVKLAPDVLRRFPHEFSGGQRQRLGIARALAVEPSLIICDEAVSALDVSIQAQILNLLGELQNELGVAYLFITHDLSVVRHLAHEVAVMHQGKIVENRPALELFEQPAHPYTAKLLSAILPLEPRKPNAPTA